MLLRLRSLRMLRVDWLPTVVGLINAVLIDSMGDGPALTIFSTASSASGVVADVIRSESLIAAVTVLWATDYTVC